MDTSAINKRITRLTPASEDVLTRLFLRTLTEDAWSYTLATEHLLPGNKSQEAYRKALNKFSRQGFLKKGQRYYACGKPRIPFGANQDVLSAYIRRYAFVSYEEHDAKRLAQNLPKKEEFNTAVSEKLTQDSLLDFTNTLFSLYFMGKNVSTFFFRLLVISVVGLPTEKRNDQNSMIIFNLLLNMLSNLAIDRDYDGIDYLGKRFFIDVYVEKSMELLYATRHRERHAEIMRTALVEDLVDIVLDPKSHTPRPTGAYRKYQESSYIERMESLTDYVEDAPDHAILDYFGQQWKTKIAAHIAYALDKTIEEPTDELDRFLAHLKKEFDVTDRRMAAISAEFRRKINNPLRIWQMNTLI